MSEADIIMDSKQERGGARRSFIFKTATDKGQPFYWRLDHVSAWGDGYIWADGKSLKLPDEEYVRFEKALMEYHGVTA